MSGGREEGRGSNEVRTGRRKEKDGKRIDVRKEEGKRERWKERGKEVK